MEHNYASENYANASENEDKKYYANSINKRKPRHLLKMREKIFQTAEKKKSQIFNSFEEKKIQLGKLFTQANEKRTV